MRLQGVSSKSLHWVELNKFGNFGIMWHYLSKKSIQTCKHHNHTHFSVLFLKIHVNKRFFRTDQAFSCISPYSLLLSLHPSSVAHFKTTLYANNEMLVAYFVLLCNVSIIWALFCLSYEILVYILLCSSSAWVSSYKEIKRLLKGSTFPTKGCMRLRIGALS